MCGRSTYKKKRKSKKPCSTMVPVPFTCRGVGTHVYAVHLLWELQFNDWLACSVVRRPIHHTSYYNIYVTLIYDNFLRRRLQRGGGGSGGEVLVDLDLATISR